MNWIRFQISYHLIWGVARINDWAQRWIAWHSPRWLIRWAVIRAYSKAWGDAGNKTPDELTFTEVVNAAGTRT